MNGIVKITDVSMGRGGSARITDNERQAAIEHEVVMNLLVDPAKIGIKGEDPEADQEAAEDFESAFKAAVGSEAEAAPKLGGHDNHLGYFYGDYSMNFPPNWWVGIDPKKNLDVEVSFSIVAAFDLPTDSTGDAIVDFLKKI
jgi:hypothetical protein